jgi:hypothetical protein
MGFELSGNLAYLDTENKDTGEEKETLPGQDGNVLLGHPFVPFTADHGKALNSAFFH